MRKNIAKNISDAENAGDIALSKETFESCVKAIDCYLSAQTLLSEAYNDGSINDGIDEEHFKTDNMDAKLWHMKLEKKIFAANEMLANPKIASR